MIEIEHLPQHTMTTLPPSVQESMTFPLSIEIIPADSDEALIASAGDEDYWKLPNIVKRVRDHFDALMAAQTSD